MHDARVHASEQLARLWPVVADWALEELRSTGRVRPSIFFLSDREPSYVIPIGSVGPEGSATDGVARDMAAANGVLVVGVWIEAWLFREERRYRGLIAHLTMRTSPKNDRLVVYRGIRLLDSTDVTGWTPVEQWGGPCDDNPVERLVLPLLPPWRPDASLENILA